MNIGRRPLLQAAAASLVGQVAHAQGPAKPDVLIDVHSHPLLPTFRKVALEAMQLNPDPSAPTMFPLPDWSLDRHLAVMDENGINVCVGSMPGVAPVLVGKKGYALARQMNEEAAAMVARHPKRLGAFATVPLDDMDATLAEMAYALDVLKLDGVGVGTHLNGRYLGERDYDPWFEEMNRRGTTLFVHPDAPAYLSQRKDRINVAILEFMFDTTRMVTNMLLSGTKQRFPRINMIATHGGGTIPYLAQRIAAAAQFPWAYPGGPKMDAAAVMAGLRSFYLDLTLAATPATLDALLQVLPPDRLLTGFDYPLVPAQMIVPMSKSLLAYPGLTPEAKQAVRSGNAQRLLPRFA